MNERDYEKMTWFDAHQMVFRAWLHLVNQDEITGGFNRQARCLLGDVMCSIKHEVAAEIAKVTA